MGLKKEKRILLKLVFQPLCPPPASAQHHHAAASQLLFNPPNVSSMTPPPRPMTRSRGRKFWMKSMEVAAQCTQRRPTACSRSTLYSAPSSSALGSLHTVFYVLFRLAGLLVVERRQMRVSRPDHQTQAKTVQRSLKNMDQEAEQFPGLIIKLKQRTKERGG